MYINIICFTVYKCFYFSEMKVLCLIRLKMQINRVALWLDMFLHQCDVVP